MVKSFIKSTLRKVLRFFNPKHNKKLLKWVWRTILAGAALLVILFIYYAKDLPNPGEISNRQIIQSTKIYDREGKVILYDIHGEEKRTTVPLSEIPMMMQKATIAAEDANFYNHHGVDFKGILRAVYRNLTGGNLGQGGSTITQQFIKISILGSQKTFTRKIKEAILAIEMEWRYSKDQILEFYLNQIPYGSNAYGIEAAAQTFFSKSSRDLTLGESALLAALPQAPTYYSPFGSHQDALRGRQLYVLDQLEKLGYFTPEEIIAAKDEKIKYNPSKQNITAPHFIMYVKDYLVKKYGEDILETGGLKVYTTIDTKLQKIADETVAKYAEVNSKKYNSGNAALVALDPKNGQILAMVGAKDYFAKSEPAGCTPGLNCMFEPNVNVAIRNRQPGSSFKPFAYISAFKKGFTPETVLFDLKTNFATGNEPSYIPRNYDGKFRGPVSMRSAIAQSLNIPAVKTMYLAGMEDTIKFAEDAGISTLKDRSRFGMALVLGGGEVKLTELTAAYDTFANEGTFSPAVSILKITDSNNNVLEEFKDVSKKIIDEKYTRMISSVLSDDEARAPIFGRNGYLTLKGRPVAVKTGTTQESRDAWAIGYTPSLVAGVWSGNNDNRSMGGGAAGYYTAAPLWHEFMDKALADTPVESFIAPEYELPTKTPLNGEYINNRVVKINRLNGKLATIDTPQDLIEEKTYPEIHNILYYVNTSEPLGAPLENPSDDPQFNNWEAPILSWIIQKSIETGINYNQLLPTQNDDGAQNGYLDILIQNPYEGQKILSQIDVNVLINSSDSIKQVDLFFDNAFIRSKLIYPYNFTFTTPANISSGQHQITIKAYTNMGIKKEKSVSVVY